jgi:hypothetical protein
MNASRGTPISYERRKVSERPLFERLGIDPNRDAWVWITTDRPVSPSHTDFWIDDGQQVRSFPLTEESSKDWNGYSFDLIGIKPHAGSWIIGLFQEWFEHLLDVRYMRVRYQQSALVAEYIATERDGQDAMIRGFHTAQLIPQPPRRDIDRAVAGMKLLFDLNQGLGGRPSNRAKPEPTKVKIAKEGWVLRNSEPVLGWDKIAARVGAPTGKTLQRWVEVDRLHELDHS